jgi:hypothetical protein
MRYLTKDFWKMSFGFLVIILLGIAGLYAIDRLSPEAQEATSSSSVDFSKY